jgi:hypothetical protein
MAGTTEIADFNDPAIGVHVCLHGDKEKSKVHVGRLQKLKEMGAEIIHAHDKE